MKVSFDELERLYLPSMFYCISTYSLHHIETSRHCEISRQMIEKLIFGRKRIVMLRDTM